MEVDEESSVPELPYIPWIYSMRREKQEIIPGIFLGPYHCATKSQLEILKNDGITHILCVRQDIEARCVKMNFPDHFKYKVIEFRDHPYESIIPRFPVARNFINECLNSGGKILVHGVNGMSRSAALVIAYIMETWLLSYDDALKLVKNRRGCIEVNYGFKNQLQEYEPICQARSMFQEWEPDPSSIQTHSKRQRDSSEED